MIQKISSAAILFCLSLYTLPAVATGIDTNTVLLMHCDGDYTDSSNTPHTINPGNFAISSDESQFGSSSCYASSSNDRMTIPTSSDWQLGYDDFTIDYWIYPTNLGSFKYMLNTFANGNTGWGILANGNDLRFFWSTDGDWYLANTRDTTTSPLSNFSWHHIAVIRDGDNLHLAVNGTILGTHDITGVDFYPTTRDLEIGKASNSAGALHGYYDEIRISKGVARWTSNFTPPTTAYSAAASSIAESATNAIASTAVPRAIGALSFVSDLVGEETEVLSTDSLDAAKAANGIKVALDSMNAADEDLGTIQAMVDQMLGLSTTGLNYQQTLKEIRAWRLR